MDASDQSNGLEPDGPIDPSLTHAALARVLGSAAFANADRLSRFLRFAVEHTLDGKGDELKEYLIGVEVFDRPVTFDPRVDSIVRVEARRLRTKLAEYYDQEGATDPLVIRLPKGGYVPRFERRNDARRDSTPIRPSPPGHDNVLVPVGRRRSPAPGIHAAGLGLTLVIAVGLGWLWRGQATSLTTVAVLPVADYSPVADTNHLGPRVTDILITELARVPTLAVRSRTSVLQYAGAKRPLREIARELDVALVLEASVVAEGGAVKLVARLVSADSDRKLWADSFNAPADDVDGLARRVAASATAAIAAHSRSSPP